MDENPYHRNQFDRQTAASRSPSGSIEYRPRTENPLAPAARSLGLVSIVLGTLRLTLLPLGIIAARIPPTLPVSERRIFIVIFVVTLCATVVLDSFLIVAGFFAIRLRERGAIFLKFWSWCTLVYTLIAACVSLGYQYHWNAQARVKVSAMAYISASHFEQWISSLILPVIVLVLLRSQPFREAFNSERSNQI